MERAQHRRAGRSRASQISAVGPSLGREYLINALWALVIAIGIQFIYIAFRFGWNYIFGLVTVIALVRDAAMMIGIYSLADKRADDAFLAAVLTVIGYSVMDTIVILDRIRENTKVMAGEPYDKIVNTSILQTMTRSVNTLATVVITLVALLALRRRVPAELRLRAAGRHLLGRLPLDLLLGAARARFRKRQLEAAARRRAGLAQDRTATATLALGSRARRAAAAWRARRSSPRGASAGRRRRRRARSSPAAPQRYRKRRIDDAQSAVALEEPTWRAKNGADRSARRAESGLHDAAWSTATKRSLNLDDFEPSDTKPASAARRRRALRRAAAADAVGGGLRSALPLDCLPRRSTHRSAGDEPTRSSSALFAKRDEYLRDRVRDDRRRVRLSHQARRRLVRRPARRHRRPARRARRSSSAASPTIRTIPTRSPCTTATFSSAFSTGGSRRTSRRTSTRARAIARASRRYRRSTRRRRREHRGVNILVERECRRAARAARTFAQRGPVGARDAAATGERVRAALIGDAPLRDAQHAVLERVEAGRNTLAVLGTGRGKSFCFQYAGGAARASTGGGEDARALSACARWRTTSTKRCADARAAGLAHLSRQRRDRRATSGQRCSRRCARARGTSSGDAGVHGVPPRRAARPRARRRFSSSTKRTILHESRHRPAYARLAATICVARQAAGARADRDGGRRGVSRGSSTICASTPGSSIRRCARTSRRRRARNQGQDRRT